MSEQPSQAVVNKYAGYGSLAGLGIGLLVGVLYGGPYFHEWPALMSLSVVLGLGVAGAVVGYVSVWLASGSNAGAFWSGEGISGGGHSSNGHASTGDGGGAGGTGGVDGGGSDG